MSGPTNDGTDVYLACLEDERDDLRAINADLVKAFQAVSAAVRTICCDNREPLPTWMELVDNAIARAGRIEPNMSHAMPNKTRRIYVPSTHVGFLLYTARWLLQQSIDDEAVVGGVEAVELRDAAMLIIEQREHIEGLEDVCAALALDDGDRQKVEASIRKLTELLER